MNTSSSIDKMDHVIWIWSYGMAIGSWTHYCIGTPYQCYLDSSTRLVRIHDAFSNRDWRPCNHLRTQVHTLYHLGQRLKIGSRSSQIRYSRQNWYILGIYTWLTIPSFKVSFWGGLFQITFLTFPRNKNDLTAQKYKKFKFQFHWKFFSNWSVWLYTLFEKCVF